MFFLEIQNLENWKLEKFKSWRTLGHLEVWKFRNLGNHKFGSWGIWETRTSGIWGIIHLDNIQLEHYTFRH